MPAIRSYVDLKDNCEALSRKPELYSLIDDGLKQVEQGKVKSMRDAVQKIRANIA